MTPTLRATGLTKQIGSHTVFSDLSLEVEPGGALALTGPSGTGKSTLLHCLGMLDRVDGGEVRIDDESVRRVSARRRMCLQRTTVGYLFQNYALVPRWSVRRNLNVAFTGQRIKRSEWKHRREAALVRVGLDATERRATHTLSGGEQQRLAVARPLIRRPRLVLADEPTAALDTRNADAILALLGELRTEGSAIVTATHDDHVVEWCGQEARLG